MFLKENYAIAENGFIPNDRADLNTFKVTTEDYSDVIMNDTAICK